MSQIRLPLELRHKQICSRKWMPRLGNEMMKNVQLSACRGSHLFWDFRLAEVSTQFATRLRIWPDMAKRRASPHSEFCGPINFDLHGVMLRLIAGLFVPNQPATTEMSMEVCTCHWQAALMSEHCPKCSLLHVPKTLSIGFHSTPQNLSKGGCQAY